jgi:predicted protein tyrosine phosphatase
VRRPVCVEEHCHLVVAVGDIVEASEGQVLPGAEHVEALLGFVRGWARERPLVIHCYAGISRSTAAAFLSACALAPHRSEAENAAELRRASPTATPNRRIVAVADDILGRQGRMVDAIARIGRGRDAFAGEPFALRID